MFFFSCHNFAKNGAVKFKFGISRADSSITALILNVVGISGVLYFYSFDGRNQFLFRNQSWQFCSAVYFTSFYLFLSFFTSFLHLFCYLQNCKRDSSSR